jgi:Holliday junction DNA helicase RuvB
MGKVRLASAIAEELGVSLTVKHGNDFSDPLDLPGVLSNIRLHQVLIIEEVDSLDARVRAMLIEVLDKFSVEIMVGVGRGARLHSLPMPKFTFIGLSTRLYRVDPLLRRWCVTYEFEPYTAAEMNSVISRLARDRGIELSSDAAEGLVQQCAGSPGNALVLVERIRRAHDVPVIGIDDLPAIFAELGLGEYQPRSLQLRDALLSMSGREFENWLAGVFRRQGYTVSLT